MIAYAAIDLRGGKVVQLVGGKPDQERIRREDALEVAHEWVAAGFAALHLIDIDAAIGTGSNRELVRAIIRSVDVPVQVGGGVRTDEAAEELIGCGAARVIVGTRAVEDPEWLASLTARFPDRVIVAADLRGDDVQTHGWTAGSGIGIRTLLARLEPLDLAAVLVTDVSREGQMVGADADTFGALALSTQHPLIAAGGIARVEDLRELSGRGVAGAVLGMSVYTGSIDPQAAAREFAT